MIVESYRNIHKKMKNKYNNQNIIKQEQANAALLQEFLINLKRTFLGRELKLNVIDKLAFSILMQQLEQQFSTVSPSNAKLQNLLFHGTGQEFENDITKLHQIAERELGIAFEKQMSKSQINIGKNSANILNTSDTIRIDEELIKQIEDNAGEAINKMVGENFHKGYVAKGKSGKIDIKGNKEVIIQYNLNNIPATIWQILASANFTLKSKKSLEWDKKNRQLAIASASDIHLGHTVPYVAIIGAISSIDSELSLEEKEKIFYGGLIEGVKNKVEEVSYHLNHLQFIYELSGAGQYYDGLGNIGEAEYLIYNDPDSDDIQVRSVAAMIAEELEQENGVYSASVSFTRKNVSKNKLTKKAKGSYNKYKH